MGAERPSQKIHSRGRSCIGKIIHSGQKKTECRSNFWGETAIFNKSRKKGKNIKKKELPNKGRIRKERRSG